MNDSLRTRTRPARRGALLGGWLLTGSLVAAPPSNDSLVTPTRIEGRDAQAGPVSNREASRENGEPSHAGEAAWKSLWWFWPAPTAGEALLRFGGAAQLRVAVYLGKEMDELSEVTRARVTPGERLVSFRTGAGKEYLIAVDGTGGNTGELPFTLHLATVPEFVVQPRSQTVYATQTAMLTAQAVGAAPMHYQWMLRGSPRAGWTNATLTLRDLTAGIAGDYVVRATHPLGSALSHPASLEVLPVLDLAVALDNSRLSWSSQGWAPWFGQDAIAHDGVDAARSGGLGTPGASILQTEVTGPVSIAFHWKISARPTDSLVFKVGGVTRSSISGHQDWQSPSPVSVPAGLQPLRWEFTSQAGDDGSGPAAWLDQVQVVGMAPRIVSEPVPVRECPGRTVSLSVEATGTPPLSYHWTRDGVELGAQTGPTLRLPPLSEAVVGTYVVRVSNAHGSVTSQPATVTLRAGGQYELAVALNLAGGLEVVPGTTPAWEGQDCETHDQHAAAQSARVGDGGVSALKVAVEGPGELSFWWRVSSQSGGDALTFAMDGIAAARLTGEQPWLFQRLSVPSGRHLVEWRYAKDGAGSAGRDAGWVDQVAFTRTEPTDLAPRVTLPGTMTVCIGRPQQLTAQATGLPPLQY